ncbi:MAG: type III-B CRISPR module RAMP protein Cmr1 [Thermoanaerobaculia bacterium]
MERVQLEIEFVTPCFLGGVHQQAEWRAASVRGQLRWWFRAVAGGACRGDLERVKRLETEVFGSTDASSPLQVRALGAPALLPIQSQPGWGRPLSDRALAEVWGLRPGTPEWNEAMGRLAMQWPVNPLLYLGYGCLKPVGGGHWQLERSCIAPGATATLQLAWRRSSGVTALALWNDALWCWFNLGGIGTRSRRGFGALREQAPRKGGGASPQTRAELLAQVQGLLDRVAKRPASGKLPEWSHFSDQSRIFVARQASRKWDEALVLAGGWLMAYRRRYGYPNDGRTLGGTPLADRDYVWAGFAPPRRIPPRGVPDRAGFGMPLPFGKPDDQIVAWGEGGRRASPLLLHVAHVEEGFFPVLTHLPARLAPDGEDVRFKGLPAPAMPPTAEQKSIVAHFLDDLASPQKNLVERVL